MEWPRRAALVSPLGCGFRPSVGSSSSSARLRLLPSSGPLHSPLRPDLICRMSHLSLTFDYILNLGAFIKNLLWSAVISIYSKFRHFFTTPPVSPLVYFCNFSVLFTIPLNINFSRSFSVLLLMFTICSKFQHFFTKSAICSKFQYFFTTDVSPYLFLELFSTFYKFSTIHSKFQHFFTIYTIYSKFHHFFTTLPFFFTKIHTPIDFFQYFFHFGTFLLHISVYFYFFLKFHWNSTIFYYILLNSTIFYYNYTIFLLNFTEL